MNGVRIALDAASRVTGYAVLDGTRILDAGRLRAKGSARPVTRVLTMRADLLALLNEVLPQTILIEMPLEKQWTRHEQRKSGMAIWAGAAWALWAFAVDWVEGRNVEDELMAGLRWRPEQRRQVIPVSNTEWTKGSTKDSRKAMVKSLYKNYDPAEDKGGDVADAIALGLWWKT